MPYEVIETALVKSSEKNGGWKYAKTILQDWVKTGIDSVEKIKAEEINFKNKQNKDSPNNKNKYNSYGQREYENLDKVYEEMTGG